MPFAWSVALKFLREGRGQTALIMVGAGVGVAIIIFLSALISGLQVSLIQQTLDTQAHLVVQPPDDEIRSTLGEGAPIIDRIQPPAQRLRSIESWPAVIDIVTREAGVVAAAPTVNGPAFAARGDASASVALRGVVPETFTRITPVDQRMLDGRFTLDGSSAVIGLDLAERLGVQVGDRIRLSTSRTSDVPFTVVGIFDLRNKDVNQRWVFVSLTTAQTMLNLPGGVSTIEVRIAEVFQAERMAKSISLRTGLASESWMERNEQLLVALRSQSSSSVLIQVFVIVAVALGIASVLGVSVVEKSREIGILRAMGARTGQVIRVFLVEGFVVGLVGSVAGCLLGAALTIMFQHTAVGPDGSPLFPVDLNAAVFLRAVGAALGTGVVAGVIPARRAARLDPATVLRYG
jgi:lipoprotein-releasing system permease protein